MQSRFMTQAKAIREQNAFKTYKILGRNDELVRNVNLVPVNSRNVAIAEQK